MHCEIQVALSYCGCCSYGNCYQSESVPAWFFAAHTVHECVYLGALNILLEQEITVCVQAHKLYKEVTAESNRAFTWKPPGVTSI